jgi:hypothetical protein
MRYFIREAMLNLQVKLSSAVNVIQINFEKISICLIFWGLSLFIFGCSNTFENCMISEFEMDDPSFEEVLKHINQATEAGDCKVRVEADGNIKNKKMPLPQNLWVKTGIIALRSGARFLEVVHNRPIREWV